MEFLIFGKFSFNHVYFLFYVISKIIEKILTNILSNNNISGKFYSMYIIFLSRILSIIPLLIYKRLSKNKKKEPKAKTNENDIQYIYNDKKRYLSHGFEIKF